MSFDILLQFNQSEKTKLDKTLTTIKTLTGELKDATSIIDPKIIIEGDLTELSDVNYMTIPVFKRSYFVTNIQSVRTNLIEISAHVDVLTSFADAIRSNNAIIYRQENNWNLYLNDGSFRIYQNPNILTFPFPSGFSTQEFVLAIAGS